MMIRSRCLLLAQGFLKTTYQLPAKGHQRFFTRRGWDPFHDFRSILQNVERQMNEFDRDMRGWINRNGFPPFAQLLPSMSRSVPIESDGSGDKYRISIDMEGYKPENIKVSLKDRMLTINAKVDTRGADGSQLSTEVTRQYVLPENVDVDGLRSHLDSDSILRIEAPQTPSEQSQEIPVTREVGEKK
ncbi:unnamed protein product [Darwinula stevensoni]|uniref:SHSP domain-containing protein n=1 Tax=Darwinula stevensoni TaxID=69355 RepID=A0A7R8X4D6_9CRUS|nr:unnamed protein product [Darwinula stevensoni]CAG0883598.1 unnamed protein product [Darwinula stevensoni]